MNIESTGKTEVMQVDNISFLLERMARDCDELQFLRELTVNSIEAIQRSGKETGEIVWDVDSDRESLTGLRKLSIIDTGIGMTGPELVHQINHLSSSSSAQSMQGNFGVGAKISAATRNPVGMLYLSWKDGKGSMVHLWRNPETSEYGLLQYPVKRADGEYDYRSWNPIGDELKPPQINDSGTKVVLLGESEEHNTMVAPEGVNPRHRWIARYLNSRFYRFPEGISIKAREGVDSDGKDCNRLRSITGAKYFLDKWAEERGSVELGSAIAHWWILNQDCKTHGLYAAGGHVAALYKDELYELKSGRSGTTLLQTFGIFEQQSRVVIYVEPTSVDEYVITTNTARSQLIIGQEPLPWAEWAASFRERIPESVAALMDNSQSDSADFSRAIKERLKSLDDLYRIKKYKPKNNGTISVNNDATTGGFDFCGGPPSLSGLNKASLSSQRTASRRVTGDVYSLFMKNEATPAEAVDDKLEIEVRWVSEKDLGVADRAAHYVVETNTLLINRDFRVFEQFIDRWIDRYKHLRSARQTIIDVSREWFQQLLVELIFSVEFLRGDREWTGNDIRTMLSDEALTAAVLPRYHTEMAVKKSLGSRLGSLKDRVSA